MRMSNAKPTDDEERAEDPRSGTRGYSRSSSFGQASWATHSSFSIGFLRDSNTYATISHGKHKVSATAEKGRSIALSTGCGQSVGWATQ